MVFDEFVKSYILWYNIFVKKENERLIKMNENKEDFGKLIELVVDVNTEVRSNKKRNLEKLKNILIDAAKKKERFTIGTLAKMIGVSKPTVTRYLNELKK